MNLHNAQRLKDINPACKFYRQPHFCRKILQTKLIFILSLQQDLCGASRRWVVRPQSPKVDFFYPLDLIVVVSYFLVVDWCLAKMFGKCLAKMVALCFKILAKIVCSGHFHFHFHFLQLWFRPRGDKLPFFCYLSIVASREERIQVMLIF